MSDIKKVNEQTDALLEAMGYIADAKIRSIQMAKIDTVTIVDDSEAAQGVYKVSNGSATFVAYSDKDNYKKDDNVQVVIPNEGYNEQKTIIGKVVTNKSAPMTYKAPFDYFLDMTGNLFSGQNKEVGLVANDITNYATKNLGSWSCIGSPNEEPLAGFETFGIRADFMSLLSNFNTVSGNYGLMVTVKAMKDAEDAEISQEMVSTLDDLAQQARDAADNNQHLVINESEYDDYFITRTYIFDVNDMYGDPYDFDTYYTQEAIFDVSDLGPIVSVKVDLFQEKVENEDENGIVVITGSFKDDQGNLIPYEDDVFDELFESNIFCKDLYLSFGYDENKFEGDKLILYTKNNLSYSSLNKNERNKKTIYARWIHKNEAGEILIINNLADIDESCQIHWYQFKQNASAEDKLSGVQWVSIPEEVDPSDMTTQRAGIVDTFECLLVPNTDLQQERIKAVITYGGTILRSNEITFVNETEVINQANTKQFEDFDFIFEDGSSGVYYKYGNDNKILNEQTSTQATDPSKQNRKLTLRLQQSTVEDIEFIKWTFPIANTMLTCVNPQGLILNEDDNATLTRTVFDGEHSLEFDSSQVTWEMYDNGDGTASIQYPGHVRDNFTQRPIYNPEEIETIPNFDFGFYYRIDNTFSQAKTNNAITCEIVKDRISYNYSVEMRFGPANTNGSPYTVVVSFIPLEKGKTPEVAMRAVSGSKVKIQVDIIDEQGHYLDWKNQTLFKDVEVLWEWLYISAPPATGVNAAYDYQSVDHINIPEYRKSHPTSGNAVATFYDPYTRKEIKISSINSYADNDNNLTNDKPLSPLYYVDSGSNKALVTPNSANKWYSSNITYYTRQRLLQYVNHDTGAVTELHIKFSKNGSSTETSSSVTTRGAGDDKHKMYLIATSGININELYALRITINNFIHYPLVAYLPIPLYQTRTTGGHLYKPLFVGPDFVRYDSNGDTVYYQDPCYLEWIDLGPTDPSAPDTEIIVTNENNKFVEFSIFAPESDPDVDWDRYSALRTVSSTVTDTTVPDKYILRPAAYYQEDWLPHGIQGMGDVVYWTQPIIYYKNNYPNGTINKWDGQGVTINEEEGYILSNSVVAGKKEDDNTFTGVMLGDIGGTHDNLEGSISKNTGVYGFHHGSISYALKDDGTMLIGKSGRGRIYLDGNESTIVSSRFLNQHSFNGTFNPNDSTLGNGVRIDLDSAPYLYIRGYSDKHHIQDIMYINDDNNTYHSFIKSASYDDSTSPNGFMVDLTEGWIDSYGKFTLTAKQKGSSTGPQIRLSTESPWFIVRTSDLKDLLIFDSSNQYIQSANYNSTAGLKIDLTNGAMTAGGQLSLKNYNFELYSSANTGTNSDTAYIKLKNNNADQIVLSTTSPYFVVKNRAGNTLINVDSSAYYLQSADFNTTNETGTKIDLASGIITSYEFQLKAGTSPNYILMDSSTASGHIPLRIGNISSTATNILGQTYANKIFQVDWNGQAVATTARFGGWQFYEGDGAPLNGGTGHWQSIYANTGSTYTVFDASNHDVAIGVGIPTTNASGNIFNVTNPNENAKFKVHNDGTMWATKAYLGAAAGTNGGWLVEAKKITSEGSGTTTMVLSADHTGNRNINGHNNQDWYLMIGSDFGVDANGKLYSDGATITGVITATRGKIGNWTITDTGALYAGSTYLYSNGTMAIGNWSFTSSSISNSATGSSWTTTGTGGSFTIGGVTLSAGTGGSLDLNSGLYLKYGLHIAPSGNNVYTTYITNSIHAPDGYYTAIGEDECVTNLNFSYLKSFIEAYLEHGFSTQNAGYAYFA